MQLYIGCSGWSYSSWDGHFYPRGLQAKDYLAYYCKVFDYVEIDSTFYRIPNRTMAIRWANLTPASFRFTAKFPQVVTHDTRLGGGRQDLKYFFEMMKPLERKLLCLLIQIPPSLTKDEGLPKLEELIPLLWKKYRYAIEVRHKSWFTTEVYRLLSAHNICLTWSQLDAIQTPPEITSDFFYLRFIGDRSIDEKDFGRIHRDRLKEMRYWADELKKVGKLKFGIVAANNHYAGFGPATSNEFRRMVGLPEALWEDMKQSRLL